MNFRRMLLCAAGFAAVLAMPSAAPAYPPFWKAFSSEYVKPESDDPQVKAFSELAAEAKCFVCHAQGEEKEVRNPFGVAMHMALSDRGVFPDTLKDDPEEGKKLFIAAFEEASKQPSKEGDEKSSTFGDLIAQGELPGGPFDASQADPMPDSGSSEPRVADKAEVEAIAAIGQIGGTVAELAMNDDSKVIAFHLSGTSLDDEGLTHVKNVNKVVELNLKGTQITDAGLAHLEGLATLEKLHLEQTAVTDEGLKHLNGLPNLYYLNLYGTEVSDKGLEHLHDLGGLRKLYLWQTQVTDEGVKKLQEAMPEVEVIR